jgi:hypothetical protein
MKRVLLLISLVLASAAAQAESVTITQDGSAATITQSGGSAKTKRKIEQRPGYVSIEQSSGGNSATVVQSTTPATPKTPTAPSMAPSLAPTIAAPLSPTNDDDDAADSAGAAPTADQKTYRSVRDKAPPKQQQSLDALMNAMGLQNKM